VGMPPTSMGLAGKSWRTPRFFPRVHSTRSFLEAGGKKD
jgi:hypothetical protein